MRFDKVCSSALNAAATGVTCISSNEHDGLEAFNLFPPRLGTQLHSSPPEHDMKKIDCRGPRHAAGPNEEIRVDGVQTSDYEDGA